MKVVLFLPIFTHLINADLFEDLGKIDLNSIDKMVNTMARNGAKKLGKMVDEIELEDAVGAVTNLLGAGKCEYICKNGEKPKANPGYKPSSNGCGSFGIQFNVASLPGVTKCCNSHDFCYDKCNNARVMCDKVFKQCLHDVCKDLKKSSANTISKHDCQMGADIMYSGVVALGCTPFLQAQQKACICPEDTNNTKYKTNSIKTPPKKSTDPKPSKYSKQQREEL